MPARTGPKPFKFSPSIINVILMTFILVSSSLTMLIATRAAKAGDKAAPFAGLSLPSRAASSSHCSIFANGSD